MSPYVNRIDRKTFLRRLAATGLGVPVASAWGCADGGAPSPSGSARASGARLDRPVLLAWSGEGVRIAAPTVERPVAYVSRALRQVFIDRAFRDHSKWILDAHISVSTGLWRIPLPGDPAGEPITPGDELREFEELDISLWTPALEPSEGDFRIQTGRPAPLRIEFECAPVAGGEAWCSAGPFELRRCDGIGGEPCREDFIEVGTGLRHRLHACDGEGVPTRLLSWAVRA